MQVDSAFQTIYSSLKKMKWVMYSDTIEWYYAESMLYIIHDIVKDAYYFVKAKSPVNACEHVLERI